jgi:DNA-binding transcriptional MerR regulator
VEAEAENNRNTAGAGAPKRIDAVSKSPDAFRTISEVAEDLDLPQHVLRFWETRFAQIKPMKRGGGRRYYRPDDIELLRGIRHLLYGEGYTIRGVQRILKEQGPRFVVAAAHGETAGLPPRRDEDIDDEVMVRAPDLAPSRGEPGNGAPVVEIDRDDHDPGDDMDEGGTTRATRRFVGRFMTGSDPDGAGKGLSPEDVQRLRATLAELLECKRLLDQAR